MQVIDRTFNLKKFSPSMLISYLDCPIAFYYRYIAKIELKKHPALILGSATHKCIEEYFKNTKKDLHEILDDELNKNLPELELEKDEEKEQYDMGHNMVNNFLKYVTLLDRKYDLRSGISELYIKKNLVNPIDDNDMLHIPMSGIIDRLTDNGIIVEFKTSKRKWQKDSIKYKLQTLLYSLWYFNEYGKLPEKIVYIILLKPLNSRTPIQILEENYDISDLTSTFEEVKIILDKIKMGVFERPSGWHPQYCDCYKYEEMLCYD